MELCLSRREAEVLIRALDGYLPELEFDLARVKLERERHELVEYDEALRAVRKRLSAFVRAAA